MNNLSKLFLNSVSLLLEKRNEKGFWTGKLSSSALGVAVACTALKFYDQEENAPEIKMGIDWLNKNINADGGFGDSPESPSNVSTSVLCFAALSVCGSKDDSKSLLKVEGYLKRKQIDINSGELISAILKHYQNDRTFSVPILVMCALCKIPSEDAFEKIPQLPFELSLLPRSFYKALRLSVVSYAIPALIAIGITIFTFKKKKKWLSNIVRRSAIKPSLRLLASIQPESGGFLEAIPLTAFVCLCLTRAGYRDIVIVQKGITFLKNTQRKDGSWPIDVDLSTWVTTLAIKSFKSNLKNVLPVTERDKVTNHLLAIQNKQKHPFNGTSPGGWGWTSHPGSVPDGDDTSGAILALLALNSENPLKVIPAVINGCIWLISLQNKNGGFPTFTKGWGKLPFDRSCCDITSHVLLSLAKTLEIANDKLQGKQKSIFSKSILQATKFLESHQDTHGCWLPLWFGNQFVVNHKNPVYGTARVVSYLNEAVRIYPSEDKITYRWKIMIFKGCRYLLKAQNKDGSWGGDKNIKGSIEETSLAVSALAINNYPHACKHGMNWLENRIAGLNYKPSPIGLYFASLWYSEELYPLISFIEATASMKEIEKKL